MGKFSALIHLGDEVRDALDSGKPVVALESAVLTHGLPDPRNIEAMERMDAAVRSAGAIPALCLVAEGKLRVGAALKRAEAVARAVDREKAAARDLGAVIAAGVPAGLTVSATLVAAHLTGIRVFATGGIGGVHVGASDSGDISADLFELGRRPVITICSGAKSVLDIPKTLEFLETAGVPVLSYGTAEFPAFYLRASGSQTPVMHTPENVARLAAAQWDLGYNAGVVVGNPIPIDAALDPEEWRGWLEAAGSDAATHGIRGKAVTPFLLDRVATSSSGRTVDANLVLLEANARLAGEIAAALQQ